MTIISGFVIMFSGYMRTITGSMVMVCIYVTTVCGYVTTVCCYVTTVCGYVTMVCGYVITDSCCVTTVKESITFLVMPSYIGYIFILTGMSLFVFIQYFMANYLLFYRC